LSRFSVRHLQVIIATKPYTTLIAQDYKSANESFTAAMLLRDNCSLKELPFFAKHITNLPCIKTKKDNFGYIKHRPYTLNSASIEFLRQKYPFLRRL